MNNLLVQLAEQFAAQAEAVLAAEAPKFTEEDFLDMRIEDFDRRFPTTGVDFGKVIIQHATSLPADVNPDFVLGQTINVLRRHPHLTVRQALRELSVGIY